MALLLYFLKVNGLLIVFYLVYYFLLKRETFFQTNRWYLLFGIIISFVLPLLSYSKIIWVEPTPIPEINFNEIAVLTPTETIEKTVEINWNQILLYFYASIAFFLFVKLCIEILSFYKIIRNGNKQKTNAIIWVENNSIESPFSFFNYLVYNTSDFTTEELQQIFHHEKIHIQQKHSIDVLIGKVLTILCWINPIAWLYRKTILQNLEFIADNKTVQQTENTYEYQKVLLKSILNNHQLSITNQFYQSLIKKRIVMLNQQKSNRKNVWKYSVVLPALVAFFMAFQIKTVAQVKTTSTVSNTEAETKTVQLIEVIIDKNTSDEEIKKETEMLKKEYGIDLKVSKIKRNKNNEIYAIEVKYEDTDGKTERLSANGDDPIQPIRFFKELDENGKGEIGFGGESVMAMFKNNIPQQQTVGTVKTENGKTIYVINGKNYSEEELKELNAQTITTDHSIYYATDDKNINKIIVFEGKAKTTDKNGNIIIIDKKNEPVTYKYSVCDDNQKKNENIIIIDKKSATTDEMNKVDTKNIKSVNVIKEPKIIEINTTEEKPKTSYEITTENGQKVVLINTDNGNQSVIYSGNMLKMPEVPSVPIKNGNLNIYVNEKKLNYAEDFLTMDHLKIYYLEATETEKKADGVIIVKRIDVKTR